MRQRAYEIVYGTMEQGKYSDRLFHHVLETDKNLSGQEKRFLKRLSYGTIERCVELDARLSQVSRLPVGKMTPSVRTVLRMALYELLYMDQIPDAVSCHEAVELLKKKEGMQHTGFVNGVLRTILRREDVSGLKNDWQRLSLPKQLYDHLVSRYGRKTAVKIGEAFLEKKQEITLHIDTSKISLPAFRQQLEKRGIEVGQAVYMPDALVVSGVEEIKGLPGYDEGWFFVQDESSMLPVSCAGIHPGDKVVDVCSAPGGKALHALLCLAGEGTLSARDKSAGKVEKIKENIKRMGYTNVSCKVWDATVADPEWREQADVVLADVPCSGIGIIGRKPEIKYRAMENAKALVPLQRQIAEASVAMLKPGGILLYSTCTINHAENEENIQWLTQNCGMKPVSLDPCLPAKLRNKMTAQGMLQMLPGIQESDGFFVAKLQKPDGCPEGFKEKGKGDGYSEL